MLVIQERNANNLPLATYTRGMDLSGSRHGAGGIGGLLARTDNGLWNGSGTDGAHTYYSADGNGNVTCLLNSKQIVVGRYVYDPYGNTLSMSGPMAAVNPYRFSSKEYMGNSCLYAYGYRFYEPSLQRWLNKDPIGEHGGLNLYGMVGNDPLNYFDPDGLSTYFDPNYGDVSSYFSGDVWEVEAAFLQGLLESFKEDYGEINGQTVYGGSPPIPKGLGKACEIARSKFPPAARKFYNTFKKGYEAAKRAGHKKEPVLHPRKPGRPGNPGQPTHFHPGDGNGEPANHDHYYVPDK